MDFDLSFKNQNITGYKNCLNNVPLTYSKNNKLSVIISWYLKVVVAVVWQQAITGIQINMEQSLSRVQFYILFILRSLMQIHVYVCFEIIQLLTEIRKKNSYAFLITEIPSFIFIYEIQHKHSQSVLFNSYFDLYLECIHYI